MAATIPPDFDAAWYAATYPDVGMSGLSPREHYRRFGALFRRPAKGPPAPPPQAAEQQPEPETEPADLSPSAPETTPPKREEQQPPAKRPERAAIIDRPSDFEAAASVPEPAPARPGGGSEGSFTLQTLSKLPRGSDASAVLPPLNGYARLLNLNDAVGPRGAQARVSCGATAFQAGGTRIENAWFAAPSRLRLMLAGPSAADPSSSGWAVRAYQAHPSSAGELRMVGQGVRLPQLGPVVHDLELLHPLMPLLLELSDADGATRAFALVPFPSLLPGGIHGAELKAQQTEPNPIDDFWALSDALLNEAIGGEGWPDRSVSAISADGMGPLFAPHVQEWLAAVFGLSVDSLDAKKARKGIRLVLPEDSVPTVGALVSRRLGDGPQSETGAYLVAETDTYRPRWSIVLPADADSAGAAPALLRSGGGAGDAAAAKLAPVPLAIAIRSPAAPSVASSRPASVPRRRSGASPALSLVVDATSADGFEQLLGSIGASVRGEVELLIRAGSSDAQLRSAVARACEQGGRSVDRSADLRAIANEARHETLLTVSDRIDLDGGALRAIVDLLLSDEKNGSASCALLAEKIIKKDVVLQPASGGLFPTGVSFASGPRLAFGEPNALDALPELTYPVVTNTFLFTAWRRSALAELPVPPGTGMAVADDVRIGLDLMRAGHRNLCTTRHTARLSGSYAPRDGVDPVGAGFLQPQAWQDILGRVTVVRELF